VASRRPGSLSLSHDEMQVALRLVTLAQRGKPPTQASLTSTAFDRMPPPAIQGIEVPLASGAGTGTPPAPLPPMQAALTGGSTSSSGSGSAGADPMNPTSDQITRYRSMYKMAGGDAGGLGGRAAVEFMSKSGLDKGTLRTVWTRSDVNGDGKLTRGEFCVAMHLIQLAKKGIPVPSVLPGVLLEISKEGQDGHLAPALAQGHGSVGASGNETSAQAPAPAPAPVPAPAPQPSSATTNSNSMSLADALSAFSDSLLAKEAPEPVTAPAPACNAPEPVTAPAPVPAPAPAPAPLSAEKVTFGANGVSPGSVGSGVGGMPSPSVARSTGMDMLASGLGHGDGQTPGMGFGSMSSLG